MSKKTLWLSTSALVGAALITTPSLAGQVGSKDALSVSLGGQFRFQVALIDQDVSATAGRGYQFRVDESEIKVGAKAMADNGLKYGISIELNAGAADTAAADEAWAFVNSDKWGRIELGDQDDATDRMYAESDDILVGRAGPDGDQGNYFAFGTGGGIAATGNAVTGDATKVNYFSPRIGGIQVGGSYTPDSGQKSGGGAVADSDSDGDFENVFGLAANYESKFDNVEFVLSLTGEFGEGESATGAANVGDVETISVGGFVKFAGFGIGAGYVDLAEQGITQAAQTTGADAGSYYTVGGSYTSGPWGVSLNWFESSKGNTTGISDTYIQIISLDVAYDVAPGWQIAAALHSISADNINATAAPVNNDGTVFLISNQFDF